MTIKLTPVCTKDSSPTSTAVSTFVHLRAREKSDLKDRSMILIAKYKEPKLSLWIQIQIQIQIQLQIQKTTIRRTTVNGDLPKLSGKPLTRKKKHHVEILIFKRKTILKYVHVHCIIRIYNHSHKYRYMMYVVIWHMLDNQSINLNNNSCQVGGSMVQLCRPYGEGITCLCDQAKAVLKWGNTISASSSSCTLSYS